MTNLFNYLILGLYSVSLTLFCKNQITPVSSISEKDNELITVIRIDISDKKSVKINFGFNEYVISSEPYHRFNEQS